MGVLHPPSWLALIAALLSALLLLDALRRARLGSARLSDHLVWASMTAVVFAGRQMSVPVDDQISLHYLGGAALCLLLGYPRAMLSMALVIGLGHLLEPGGSIGLQYLAGAALPVWISYRLLRASQRWMPPHLFVFLLGAGFAGLFITYAVQIFALAALHVWLGSWPHDGWGLALPFALMLAAGETVIEGMLITLLVVYAPHHVRLYDDAFYLGRPVPR